MVTVKDLPVFKDENTISSTLKERSKLLFALPECLFLDGQSVKTCSELFSGLCDDVICSLNLIMAFLQQFLLFFLPGYVDMRPDGDWGGRSIIIQDRPSPRPDPDIMPINMEHPEYNSYIPTGRFTCQEGSALTVIRVEKVLPHFFDIHRPGMIIRVDIPPQHGGIQRCTRYTRIAMILHAPVFEAAMKALYRFDAREF